MKHQYKITGMHCGACVEKVQSALAAVDGVEAAEVTLEPPRAAVTMDSHIDTDTLQEAVAAKGSYGLEELEHENGQDAGFTNGQSDQEEKKELTYILSGPRRTTTYSTPLSGSGMQNSTVTLGMSFRSLMRL